MDLLAKDASFIQSGGKIFYALDTSELRSYLNPKLPQTSQLRYFASDPSDLVSAIQTTALHYLLFGRAERSIMLLPHLMELNSYFNHLRLNTVPHTVGVLARAATMLEQPKHLELLRTYSVRIDEVRALPPSERIHAQEALATEITEHLPLLIQTAEDLNQSQEFTRLTSLLAGGVLSDSSSLPLSDQAIDERSLPIRRGTVNRWRRLMESKPNTASAYLDAEAMATLEALDSILFDSRIRVCLVTRSETLHECMRADLRNGWRGPSGNLLRHPRSLLLASHYADQGDSPEAAQALEDALKSVIEVVLEFADQSGNSFSDSKRIANRQHSFVYLANRVEAVKRHFRDWCTWTIASAWPEMEYPPTELAVNAPLEQIKELLDSLFEDQYLVKYKLARIEEFIAAFAANYGSARVFFDNLSNPNLFDSNWPARNDPEFIPCALSFSDPAFESWYRGVRSGGRTDLNEVIQLCDGRLDGDASAEALLVLAYYFAAIDLWTDARHLAGLSGHTSTVLSGRCNSDALIFEAICIRMLPDAPEDAAESCATLLDQAAECLRDNENPTLLLERAAQHFRWAGSQSHNMVMEGAKILDRVDDLLREHSDGASPELGLRSLNMRIFFLFDLDVSSQKTSIKRWLGMFRDELTDRYGSSANWPVNYFDTILWTEWRLRKSSPRTQADIRSGAEIRREYRRLLDLDLRVRTRRILEEHLYSLPDA